MLPYEFKAYSLAIKTALWACPVGFILALQTTPVSGDGTFTELWRASLTVIGTLLLLIGRSVLANQKKLAESVEKTKQYQRKLDEVMIRVVYQLDPVKGHDLVKMIDQIMEEVRDN